MSNNDTITLNESDILASIDDTDTITLSNWDSPLTTSLSGISNYPSATLGAATVTGITNGGTLSTSWNNTMWTNTSTASPYTVSNGTTGWTTYNNQPQVLKVEGDAEFKGEVTIRGVKLDERLTAIEERLGILRPNNDLEGKWEKLKALGEEYRKLDQEILEGESIWATLKK